MARIDDPANYNPFGWRLAEVAERITTPERRGQLVEELVVWEAEELAHRYRHLTIEHGDPDELEASRLLSALYDWVGALVARVAGTRVRGTVDYVTVTVHGPAADDAISDLTAIAEELNPGDWRVTSTACPPGIVAT